MHFNENGIYIPQPGACSRNIYLSSSMNSCSLGGSVPAQAHPFQYMYVISVILDVKERTLARQGLTKPPTVIHCVTRMTL